jgi:hypothetical protein
MRAMLIAMTVAVFPTFAQADCFENLGNTGCPHLETFKLSELRQLSCQNLWHVRNSIYNHRGYCFKTAAAQQVFDNSDCFVTNASAIKFNQHEQKNISRIVKVEKEKSC